MRTRVKIVFILILTLSLGGCWDQRIYEQIGFILQVGIESSDDKSLLLTLTSPVVGGDISNQVELVEVVAGNLRESREKARMSSPKTLEAGKIQQILISKELAEKGIHNLLEVYERDPTNPALAFVAIVDGSPNHMLKKASKFADKPRAAFYINQLIEGNIKSSYIPETRVYDFDIMYFAPGLDPIAPMIHLKDNSIGISGTALFHNDKMVGQINPQQTSLLLSMKSNLIRTEYIARAAELPVEHNEVKRGIAIALNNVKSKIKVDVIDDKPVVTINMSFIGSLDEYMWYDLSGGELFYDLVSKLENEIEMECNKIVKYLQEVGSDPIGIGNEFRSEHYYYWQEADWDNDYKEADIKVNVDLNIRHYGVIS